MADKKAGRPAGARNKTSGAAKDNITAVFTRLGGTAAMARWAKRNQSEFYRIYSRLLPHEVTGVDGQEIVVKVVHQLAGVV